LLDRQVAATPEDLLAECRATLNAGETDVASLKRLIDLCMSHLEGSARQAAIDTLKQELEDVARMIESQAGVWPEDVERFESLARQVRARPVPKLAPATPENAERRQKDSLET